MRLCQLGALCAVFALVAAGTTYAVAETPNETEVDGRLMLVLDSSGSMKEPVSGGGTKIDAAKKALKEVAAELPDDAEVGMRVFGAKVFSAKDKGACTDTQNVVPVGKRTILLLSDGEPTCKPDPCDVAKDLRESGVDLKVNVVGLSVSGKARKALECIADAGGGTYYDVNSPEELAQSLVAVSVRALREFSIQGKPVKGGTTASQALPLKPGQYADHIAPGETSRFYLIDKKPGFSMHASATGRPEVSDQTMEGFTLKFAAPDGGGCADQSVRRTNVLRTKSIVSASVSFIPDVTKFVEQETCKLAKQFILEVTFERSDTDKPFELVISELPKVLNLTALPTPVDTLEPYLRKAVATGAQARPILGGASFNNAPMLKPGVYEDTIRPGEELIYRVPVGWGQAPRVTATVESDARADQMLDLSGNTIDISAFNPVRGEILTTSDGPHDVYQNALYNGAEAEDVTAALPPVRLKNAGADGIYIDRAALAGDYFFSVEMGRLDEDTNFAAPMTIAVELDGKVSGVPKFSEPVKAANDDKMAKKESGTPVALWGGLGGLTVIALGGAAFFLSRRSGKPTATEQ